MDRQTTLLLSLGTLIAAALAVGIGGWILLLRDRRLAKSDPSFVASSGVASSGAGEASTPGDVSRPEATEGS